MKIRLMFVRSLLSLLCAVGFTSAGGAQTSDDLFNPDVVTRVDLLVNSLDWEKLKADFQVNDYYPADVQWAGVTVRNVGIRSRGLGSRSGTKPGLRVDFDRYASGQRFLGLKSVILDNLTQDASGVRERIAMRFFARMGLPAPREAHIAVYVNDSYAGLYAVVESIDKDFLRRVFGANRTGTEDDGHLFEYEYSTEWFFNYPGEDLEIYAGLFDPVTHKNASIVELYAPVEAMVRAINTAPDDQFVPAVSAYLDLPLFMKHVAVQNFLADLDGVLGYAGVNNFYLYRFEDSLRSQFIAWDEDHAFYAADWPVLQGHDANILMRRAMSVPELRAAYFAALQGAAADAAGWLEQEIQQQRALVTPFMLADPVKPFANEEFEAGMEALLAFARIRPGFVRCEVARLTDEASVPSLCEAVATRRSRQ